jgi:hypothetical protein
MAASLPRRSSRRLPTRPCATAECGHRSVTGPIEPPQIVTVAGTTGGTEPTFPDLVGMNARDAVQLLARMGIGARLQGAGIVVEQRPAAGSPLNAAAVASLWLERHPRGQVRTTERP